MKTWGQFVARRSWAVLLAAVAVVLVAAAYGVGVFGSLSNGGFDDPATDSAKELALEQATFPGRETDLVVVYSSPTLKVQEAAFRTAVTDTLSALPAADVAGAITWYATQSPGLVSTDGHATRVVLTLAGTTQDEKSHHWDAVKGDLSAPGLSTSVGGPWAVFGDVNEQVSADIARAESISLPIVFLLSLLIFGSLLSALMPTLVGGIAVMGAFAVVRLITGVTDVSIFSINVITLLGMGLAIDYALFVVSRFREELAVAPDTSRESVRAAVVRTMTTAGRTVLFSGLIVAAALASLLLFPQNFLRSMGYGGMAAVLVAMVAALTVLPALLGVLGSRIEFGRMPWRRTSCTGPTTTSSTASGPGWRTASCADRSPTWWSSSSRSSPSAVRSWARRGGAWTSGSCPSARPAAKRPTSRQHCSAGRPPPRRSCSAGRTRRPRRPTSAASRASMA